MELDKDIKQRLNDYIGKALKVKTTIHWWDLYPIRSVKIKPELQVKIVRSAIKKAGSQEKVAKIINVKQATISKWLLLQRDIFVCNLINLCNFVGCPFNKVERNIVKISGLKYPNLPFNLTSPEAIKIRAAFLSDGHVPRKITAAPHYKSNTMKAHRDLILRCKKIFGSFKIRTKYIKDDHVFVTKFPSVIGDTLALSGVVRGNKSLINPYIPADIILGDRETKKSYLQQVFDDEGGVGIERRSGGKIILARNCVIDKINGLKENWVQDKKLKQVLLEKSKRKINNLIYGESLLLNSLGIVTNLYVMKNFWISKVGTISAQWALEIFTKKDLENFRKTVGFTLNDKREKLEQLISNLRYSFHNNEGIEFAKTKIFEIEKNNSFKFSDLAKMFKKEKRCISLTSHYIKKLENEKFIKKVKQGIYQLTE
ncbi:MAG: hypothetical protein COV64_01420 [Candidatus Nealsonbacteria bacterium CG11_big_fil_rev_8_21_14_0_20_39_9]|uniref:DOD-type homing endonuclease domain-containing protein n=1 Tax=Candidatus Nealsonbacteria bacterium CG11_big_fil_rev_8_21_14_0_20_39_9 TaxID=1974715 RepID=A0A2H0MP37_9BACT|nr:MAG: hypothetical protein COV64_01420 [Candidatus Nealsonbacteria bacterium CG11_big_fil_rev_8_21_14_0_20_39_9]